MNMLTLKVSIIAVLALIALDPAAIDAIKKQQEPNVTISRGITEATITVQGTLTSDNSIFMMAVVSNAIGIRMKSYPLHEGVNKVPVHVGFKLKVERSDGC